MLTFLRPYLFWPRCRCREFYCLRLSARKASRSRKHIAQATAPGLDGAHSKTFITAAVSRQQGRGDVIKMLAATKLVTMEHNQPKKRKQRRVSEVLPVWGKIIEEPLQEKKQIGREDRGLARQPKNEHVANNISYYDSSFFGDGVPDNLTGAGGRFRSRSLRSTQDHKLASPVPMKQYRDSTYQPTYGFKPQSSQTPARPSNTAKVEITQEVPLMKKVVSLKGYATGPSTSFKLHHMVSPRDKNSRNNSPSFLKNRPRIKARNNSPFFPKNRPRIKAAKIKLVPSTSPELPSRWKRDYARVLSEPWNLSSWKQPKPAPSKESTRESFPSSLPRASVSNDTDSKSADIELSEQETSEKIKSLEESAREMKQLLESFFPTENKPNRNGNGNNGKKIPWMDVSEAVRSSADDTRRVELVKHEYVRQVFSDSLLQAEESKEKTSNGPRRDLILTNIGKTMLASDISRIAYHLNKQNLGRGVEKIIPIRDILYLDRRAAFAIITNSADTRVNFQKMLEELQSNNSHHDLTFPPASSPGLRVRAIDGSTLVPSRLFDGGASPERCVKLVLSGCPHEIIRKAFENTILRSSGLSRTLLQGDLVPGKSLVALSSPEQDEVAHEGAWLVKFEEGHEAEADRLEREWHLKEIQIPSLGAGDSEQSYRVVVQAEVTRW